MKTDIHPKYFADARVVCACGNTWTTGSTRKEIRVEICSNCHPFFSGENQRIVDIEGQVDRFYKRLQARQDYLADQKTREESRVSLSRPINELDMNARMVETLAKGGVRTVGQFLEKLNAGEDSVLAIEGFGRKSLIDLKKKLRSLGYEIPEAVA
jgi:large subunit ribosomal protein L31